MSNYQLTLIQYPSGTYGFVGSVPLRLAYLSKAGDFVTAVQVEREMRLPASARTIKSRTFASPESAIAAAKLIGCSFEIKLGERK